MLTSLPSSNRNKEKASEPSSVRPWSAPLPVQCKQVHRPLLLCEMHEQKRLPGKTLVNTLGTFLTRKWSVRYHGVSNNHKQWHTMLPPL